MKKQDQLSHFYRIVQYCLPNLKLRNQFMIIVAVLVLLIVAIFAIWNIAHQTILNTLFLEESDKLYDIQSKIRISQMLNNYKSYFYQLFALNGNALISFHRLYLRTKKEVVKSSLQIDPKFQMEYEGMIQIPDPLRILNEYGSNISNSFMCYSNTSAYNSPLTEEEKIGIKLQEQIQAYGQILYQGSLIMQSNIYSYIDHQKINNLYPCVNRGKGIYTYAPEKRDWYKTLKQTYYNSTEYNSYKFKFTAPYLLFTYQTIGLSMTLPIVDENLKFLGGVSSTFLGSKLVQYLSNNSTGFQLIYLVSDDGTLIMHPFNVKANQLPLYIFNESFTGFNQTDWIEIKSTEGISSCKTFNLRTTLKCRYNSFTQQEMIVSIENLKEYKMYLIMLLSSEEYMTFTNSFHYNLKQNLINETIIQIVSLIILFIVLCIIIIIATQILFQPLDIIVNTTQIWLHKRQQHVQLVMPKLTQYVVSNEILMLEKACQYIYKILEMTSFHKTEQCEAIEKIQYPTHYLKITPYIEYYEILNYNGYKQNKIKNYVRDKSKVQIIFDYILKAKRNINK